MTEQSDIKIEVGTAIVDGAINSNVCLDFNGGKISAITNGVNRENSEDILLPGMIDIQINGGGDKLFNNQPTAETLDIIDRAHLKFGTTRWLPTLITDSFSKMEIAANAIAKKIADGDTGIVGVHFEGPHLSTTKKGVHPLSQIRPLHSEEMNLYLRGDLGQVVVTVAPETVECEQIQQLVEAGVRVCLGHSNADYQQVKLALNAGASGFTHLYNAMSPLQSRAPGMVGAALESDAYYGLILDGVHVHPAAAKAAYRANSNMILVTDAMAVVGGSEEKFEYLDQMIEVVDGELKDSEGRLAGSVLDMSTGLQNARQWLTTDFAELSKLVASNAARFLNIDGVSGAIKVGAVADFILLDGKTMALKQVWRNGQQVQSVS